MPSGSYFEEHPSLSTSPGRMRRRMVDRKTGTELDDETIFDGGWWMGWMGWLGGRRSWCRIVQAGRQVEVYKSVSRGCRRQSKQQAGAVLRKKMKIQSHCATHSTNIYEYKGIKRACYG